MQFPESWLREFCNPSLSTQELADTLTMAGPARTVVLKPNTLCPHISLVILDNVGVNLKKFAPKKT